jgi:hypothetical protein
VVLLRDFVVGELLDIEIERDNKEVEIVVDGLYYRAYVEGRECNSARGEGGKTVSSYFMTGANLPARYGRFRPRNEGANAAHVTRALYYLIVTVQTPQFQETYELVRTAVYPWAAESRVDTGEDTDLYITCLENVGGYASLPFLRFTDLSHGVILPPVPGRRGYAYVLDVDNVWHKEVV